MAMVAPDWGLLSAAMVASLAVVMTPGPNNIILAAVGAEHGFRRAVPYALGVIVGFPLMLAGVGLGLGNALRLWPQLQIGAKFAGAAFLLWLAWRIAFAPPRDVGAETRLHRRPPGFWQSVAFQWINPKGVSYAFGLIAVYARPHALPTDVPMLMLATALLSLLATATWVLAGTAIGRFLSTPVRQRRFNRAMGALLLLAAASILH